MVIRCERWFGKCWLLQAGGIGGVGRWGIDVSNRPYQLPSKTCKGGESKWRMLGARVRLECTAIMNTVHSLKGITCLLEQRMNSWGPPPPPRAAHRGSLGSHPFIEIVRLFVQLSISCFVGGKLNDLFYRRAWCDIGMVTLLLLSSSKQCMILMMLLASVMILSMTTSPIFVLYSLVSFY